MKHLVCRALIPIFLFEMSIKSLRILHFKTLLCGLVDTNNYY